MRQAGSIVFFILSLLFAGCVALQVYIAGAATFINPGYWAKHVAFVHLFGFTLPVFMLLLAWLCSMPRNIIAQVGGIIFTVFFMYFSANITGTLPWMGALHPVVALVIAVQSIMVVSKGWNVVVRKETL